ncbi:hypothetical protein CGMCC3_g15275 [Colletotrichum fructicola]|nr:uncharacterized protein CGMCC3_g15275 [Colletotrichum fructicola]KAE9568553.1 hypothetical protein CGMCC3_g15275 [Colletotrichum fructicola]
MQTDWVEFVNVRSCENRYFNKFPPALRGTWGKHNFKIYEDLLKAQSTILLHCRTGVNGLNACLNFMSFKLAPSSVCPCGARPHDARHLFMECPLLAAPRKHLKAAMHVFCFHVLVTDYPELAANFAIRYFSLEQFAWTAKRLVNPDFGNLPTGGLRSRDPPDNFTIFNFTSATMWFVITQLLQTTELSTYPLSRASPAPPSNTVSITASPSAIKSSLSLSSCSIGPADAFEAAVPSSATFSLFGTSRTHRCALGSGYLYAGSGADIVKVSCGL